jgi:hypothetical protein
MILTVFQSFPFAKNNLCLAGAKIWNLQTPHPPSQGYGATK